MAVGAVLLQRDDADRPHIIEFASQALNTHQRNYSIPVLECYAIVWALRKFRPYLHGVRFTVFTDHYGLTFLKAKKNPSSHLQRWWYEVSEYDFEVVYREGEKNIADALSRLVPKSGEPSKPLVDESALVAALSEEYEVEKILGKRLVDGKPQYLLKWKGYPSSQATWTATKHMRCDKLVARFEKECAERQEEERQMRQLVDLPPQEELAKLQAADAHLQEIRRSLMGEEVEYKARQDAQECWIMDNIIYHAGKTPDKPRLAVPDALKERLIRAHHDLPLAGHLSAKKMKDKLATGYWWHGMRKDVRDYVARCAMCNSRHRREKDVPLTQPERVGEPFERVGIDFMKLPMSHSGNDHLIIIVDHASKWVEAKACKGETAENAARTLFENIICRHGCPREVWSDRGRAFLNEIMVDLAKWCGFSQHVSSGYHPQSNGLTERTNRTFLDMLAKAGPDQLDWDAYLPAVTWAYNTSTNSATGLMPYELLYGHPARQPQDVSLLPAAKKMEATRLLEQTRGSIQRLQREGLLNQQRSAEQQAKQHDKHATNKDIRIGSIVRWWRPSHAIGKGTKLSRPWTGPWKVVAQAGPVNWWLENEQHRRITTPAHANDLSIVQEHFEPVPVVTSEGEGV